MKRVPEPELMEDEAQARAYSEADFSEPHAMFVRLCGEAWAGRAPRGRMLDLGCGPGDVTVRLAERFPLFTIDGVDGSEAMLGYGAERVRRHGLEDRVRLIRGHLPACPLPGGYDAIVSNSLLHHLSDPAILWDTVRRCARPGAAVFVMDLMRPEDEAAAQALTERHAAGAPAVLRRDFFHSLLAAYRPEEVRAQLAGAGLEDFAVRAVSDRHLVVSGCLPGTDGVCPR
ncbi:MAG: class I SAM-dependent methyltransferase [Gammaproteobacteria bacterium]|nr:class I SAM-dependent methyltransferase [Gammaproteobacteria bacterium]